MQFEQTGYITYINLIYVIEITNMNSMRESILLVGNTCEWLGKGQSTKSVGVLENRI